MRKLGGRETKRTRDRDRGRDSETERDKSRDERREEERVRGRCDERSLTESVKAGTDKTVKLVSFAIQAVQRACESDTSAASDAC